MSKRYDDPIEVLPTNSADSASNPISSPSAFRWRGRTYTVDRVIKVWLTSAEYWDPERRRDCEFYRVEADDGIFDLEHNRLASRDEPPWRLSRVWD